MRKMKSRKKNKNRWEDLSNSLRDRTSISTKEIKPLVKKYTNVSLEYAIWKLQQEEIISKARRGLYLIGGKDDQAFIKNPFEAIYTLVDKNVVLGYGTALFLHGISRYGMLTQHFIISKKYIKPKQIGNILVRFVQTPSFENHNIMRLKYSGYILNFTDLERTIVDCIHRPKYAQGWENIIHSIKLIKRLDSHKLLDYVKRIGIPSLASRVGIIMEHFKKRLKIEDEEINTLLPYLPRKPVKIERGINGRLNKKWNIYIPEDFLNE